MVEDRKEREEKREGNTNEWKEEMNKDVKENGNSNKVTVNIKSNKSK